MITSETFAEVHEDPCATTAKDDRKNGVDETPGEPPCLAVAGEAEEDRITRP